MAAKGRRQRQGQERARFVCVTRFGSHQCGSVVPLGGRQSQGVSCPGLEAHDDHNEEEPLAPEGAMAAPGLGAEASTSSQGPALRARRSRGPRARAGGRGTVVGRAGPLVPASEAQGLASGGFSGRGCPPVRLIRKDADGKFDFPIPLNEASKILKKKKKVSVWNNVYKVISKMLEENEKYRLRLKCQKLSNATLCYGLGKQ
ncbi:uncharacterized protein C5orf47 homolog [Lepus europaeus]|uniref:uncharacterized protein C5orf47 homolog n=1 Tax=Lepus europaeus TaxID=9983 RepID=UPI002B458F35|nr:uncharacterized protein C5orf47 homolog [Lepus europaeus]